MAQPIGRCQRCLGAVPLLIAVMVLALPACSTLPSVSAYRVGSPAGDFWIGDVGPGAPRPDTPRQQPFICTTELNGLGQPLIDNHAGVGHPVFPRLLGLSNRLADPIGYSRDCATPTRVDYFYYSQGRGQFRSLRDPARVPRDVERIRIDGEEVNFVVRVERGTINRFLYSIAMLAPYPESLERPAGLDNRAWNRRLVYKFSGGVGLGHWQGKLRLSTTQGLHYESLRRGYAVAFSTGNSTVTHYNMRLAQETAAMVKQHFSAVYGAPVHTIGIGGSGGGIQQYLIGEHAPGLLDAAIPQLSYPDMITQVAYVADCDLLERLFDQAYRAAPDSHWADWRWRARVVGLSASAEAQRSSQYENPDAPRPGGSVCSRGWRGHVPLVFNPRWAPEEYFKVMRMYRYPEAVIAAVKWTHWNDLADIYPQDPDGLAPNSWDNVGVQYGLAALKDGDLTVAEFLEINACVGGWRPPQAMGLGAYPWNRAADRRRPDPWDQANMTPGPDCVHGPPAPRTAGSLEAMRAAITHGQVFTGRLAIPVIDVRWYLEPALDIHHGLASFASRARMLARQGRADNQVIWVAACEEIDPQTLERLCPYDPTADALEVIEAWLTAIAHRPEAGVIANRPDRAVDACFDADGGLIARGDAVWAGVLDGGPAGACTRRFPVYPTSRMIAGEGIAGDRFKCALKPVATALIDGSYGGRRFDARQQARLREIFPIGVCDYDRPDRAW